MSFERSPILEQNPGIEIITDQNYTRYQNDTDTGGMRGYIPRDFSEHPLYGSYDAYSEPLIPRSEMKDRIEYRVKTKTSLLDTFREKKVPILNQKNLGYCWVYGVVGGMMMVRAKSNLPTIGLSATSAGAKIKDYRNVGGWGEQAIKGIDKYGVSTFNYWPEAKLDRSLDTPEQRANAELHKFTEVEELKSNSIDHVLTALLNNHPVTLALNWWRHLVYALDVVYDRGKLMVLIANSWGDDWSDGGLGLLDLSRATPHEAFALKRCTLTLV